MPTPPDLSQTPLSASRLMPGQEAEADLYEGADVDQSDKEQLELGREFMAEHTPTFKRLAR